MSTATAITPHASRGMRLAFAPLVLLVAAAVVTNVGGGMSSDAHAASVNITAATTADKGS